MDLKSGSAVRILSSFGFRFAATLAGMSSPVLWQHLGFRRLYLSSVSFVLGTQIYQLALPLIFYELTHSAPVMAGLRAIELLPNLLLAMFIGVWVDRIDRGRWARRAMSGMVVLMGLQAVLLTHGEAVLALFFVCAFMLMTLNYLYAICRMGLVKEMLPAPLLLPATAQLTVISQVAGVVGPAIAGALVAWKLSLGLWLPMAALLLAAGLLRGVELPARPFMAAGFWQDWWEGVQVLRANRALWHLAWWVVLINGSAGVVEVLFLFRARDALQFGPAVLGVLYGVAGLGGVCGGLLCSRLRSKFGLGRLMLFALGLEAVSILILAWSDATLVLVCGLAINGFAGVSSNVCVWGFRQESTSSAHIGRVSGLTGSLFKVAMPVALVVSGQLASCQALGALLSACAGAHLIAWVGLRCSPIYRVR